VVLKSAKRSKEHGLEGRENWNCKKKVLRDRKRAKSCKETTELAVKITFMKMI
jgi:hypothetical protein